MSCSSNNSKIDIKVVQSKSQKKVIFAEANGDFVNFILSFLTMPLGSIIKLLGPNSFDGCVTNLYKSVENLDSSLCTCSHTVLLNPGVAPQFGCPKQLLNIPHAEHPLYYYGTGTSKLVFDSFYKRYINAETKIEGGVFSKKPESIFNGRTLTALDPRSPNRSKEGVVGFVKKEALYGVGDDLTVKALSADFCLSYFKESSIPLDDLEVKVISIGEVEVRYYFITAEFITFFFLLYVTSLIPFTCGVGYEHPWSFFDIKIYFDKWTWRLLERVNCDFKLVC